ncbi:MAG TPA: Maf family protein [Steroidobacteraceae bacterium]|nr:Maf family protein [Steroidobacteraceae bacterium]
MRQVKDHLRGNCLIQRPISPAPVELILASGSPYRRALLSRLGLDFLTETPGVDEAPTPQLPAPERAQHLAFAKAAAVAGAHPHATIIGSDQVALCKGEVLEKPGNAARCREQLHWASAATASFYTAVSVQQPDRARLLQFIDCTTVHFRTLSAAEIERYIAAERPWDCAGGFRCEGLGISLFTRIVTEDPTALIGLPLIGLSRVLRELGFELP